MRGLSSAEPLAGFCLSSLRGRKVHSLMMEGQVKSLDCLVQQSRKSSNLRLLRALLAAFELTGCRRQHLEGIISLYCAISLFESFGFTEELLLWSVQRKNRCRGLNSNSLNYVNNFYTSMECRVLAFDTPVYRTDEHSLDITSGESERDVFLFGSNALSKCHRRMSDKEAVLIRPSLQLQFEIYLNSPSCRLRNRTSTIMKAILFDTILECHDVPNFVTWLIKTRVKIIFAQQTINECIKEYLLNENILFIERLGKVQAANLRKIMQESSFCSADEFVFSMRNSSQPPESLLVKLERDSNGVFVLLKKKTLSEGLISSKEKESHLFEIDERSCIDALSLSPLFFLNTLETSKSSFIHIDNFFEELKLYAVNLFYECFLFSSITDHAKRTLRKRILINLSSSAFFDGINYTIRLLQTI